jgi:ATP-dependent Lon protease
MFSLDAEKAQSLLEAPTRAEALRMMHRYLTHEVQVLELRNKITTEARSEMNKEQRDYLLRQQMRAIQQELGEKGGEQAEAEQLRERLEKADLPEDILKEASANWIGWKNCLPARRTIQRDPDLSGLRAGAALAQEHRRFARHRARRGRFWMKITSG